MDFVAGALAFLYFLNHILWESYELKIEPLKGQSHRSSISGGGG